MSKFNAFIKDKNKVFLAAFAIIFVSVMLIFISGAWFTSSSSETATGTINFGSVDISAEGGTDNEEAVVTVRDVEDLTSAIMPGSTLSASVRVNNIGTADCYYLVCFICNDNILSTSFNNDYFYNAASTSAVKSTIDNKLCGTIVKSTSQTINVKLVVNTALTEEELSNSQVQIKCIAYAVQKANLTQEQAYYILQTNKCQDYPESKTFLLHNEDLTVATSLNNSGVEFKFTDDTQTQFYLDATALRGGVENVNSLGEDLYFYSSVAYDETIFSDKYATTDNSYLAKLAYAKNYDLTFDANKKYIYDVPSYSLSLYPVYLKPNVGDNDTSKNTYVKDTTDYMIISKDKTEFSKAEYQQHLSLKAVVIPNSISTVGLGAFNLCSALKFVTLPTSNLTTLGRQAFSKTNIENIIIPECVKNFNTETAIGIRGAFSGSNLKRVYINSDMENFTFAFAMCPELTEITFGPKCTYIKGMGGLGRSPKLETVTFTNVKQLINCQQMFDGCPVKKIDFNNKLESITGRGAFYNMPELLEADLGNSLKTLSKVGSLFGNCRKLEKANFGNSLTEIYGEGNGLDGSCNLLTGTKVKSFNIPNTLKKISGLLAFAQCNLEGEIGFPAECTVSGDSNGPFVESYGITSFYLKDENGVRVKESSLYVERDGIIYKKLSNGKLRLEFMPGGYSGELRIAKDVTDLRRFEVDSCRGLTKFIVDSNNPSYKSDSYGVLFNKSGTQLRSFPGNIEVSHYDVPNGVTQIFLMACYHPISLTVPDSLTSLPGCAMQNSQVTRINSDIDGVADLSNTKITKLGYKSFDLTTNLTKLILPSTCSRIESGAINDSKIAEIVTYYNGVIELLSGGYNASGNPLSNATQFKKLHILNTLSTSIYSNNTYWSKYLSSSSTPAVTIVADVEPK